MSCNHEEDTLIQDHTHSAYLQTLEQAAFQLICQSMADPWSLVSASIYETASLVKAPRAFQANPEKSLVFLLNQQKRNGSWGGPGLYAVVPSLAATAGILHILLEGMKAERVPDDFALIAQAVQRGLFFLASILSPEMLERLPDTIAVELIVPALIEEIHDTLGNVAMIPQLYPEKVLHPLWSSIQQCLTIRLPEQEKHSLLRARDRVLNAKNVPPQICHCLEVLGKEAKCLSVPQVNGAVGCSPAATGTMLALSDDVQLASLTYLKEISSRLEGAFPSISPIAQFERAWIISSFLQVHMPLPTDSIEAILTYCQSCLGPRGTGAGDGLPSDADDSAVMFSILSLLGVPTAPTTLFLYERETSFCCFEGERTPSISANAHTLEAFCTYLLAVPSEMSIYQSAIEKLTNYLLSEQRPDGSWLDKWHASPFYATWCCVLALRSVRFIDVSMMLDHAVTWVLKTQKSNGSWGIWHGTLEETAYALLILMAMSEQTGGTNAWRSAVEQGKCFLQEHLDISFSNSAYTSLWHDKELYTPIRVVHAIVLSALYQSITKLEKMGTSTHTHRN